MTTYKSFNELQTTDDEQLKKALTVCEMCMVYSEANGYLIMPTFIEVNGSVDYVKIENSLIDSFEEYSIAMNSVSATFRDTAEKLIECSRRWA